MATRFGTPQYFTTFKKVIIHGFIKAISYELQKHIKARIYTMVGA